VRVALTSVHCWPDVRRGGERYVHELAAGLRRAGVDVSVLSTGSTPGRDEVLGVPVRRLRARHWLRYGDLDVEAAFGLQSLGSLSLPALAGRYDVWHATSTSDAAAASAVSRTGRVRSVFTDHGFPARASRERRADGRAHRYVVEHVDAYVCVSEAAGSYLRSDFAREPRVVPPGVDWAQHAPATREARPTVLYSGSLSESRKGVATLLSAAELLRAQVPALQVWLLGPGEPPTTPDPTLVTRCGLEADVALREAYGRAWVTCLPSTAESFGMTVVESLACGTPVVVRADGGGPAEIVQEGVGVLAEGTVEGLADALARGLDLAQRPGTVAACRDRARAYDWDGAVVPRMLEVYAG
jgi:glycosyltransferase involved in cell wall biosynthesis